MSKLYNKIIKTSVIVTFIWPLNVANAMMKEEEEKIPTQLPGAMCKRASPTFKK